MDELAPQKLPLSVSAVSTAYGKKEVLKGISLSLSPGEAFGLIGLNGAGKTTLIRSILGLRSAAGEITLYGESNTDPRARRHLIYLPEKFLPSSQLVGWEYLGLLLSYFGQKLDRETARAIAAGLDLDPGALDHRIRTYSKGMAQKLGLAGSFLVRTPLMILDEPMSGLDPRARALLKDRLREDKAAGRSIFFSSHILSDIEEICDRIGVIHLGRMAFLGTPQALISRYGTPTLERAFLAVLEDTERNTGESLSSTT